jgi:hypothetical protein
VRLFEQALHVLAVAAFGQGLGKVSNCSLLMKPLRQAISSTHAIFRPWRFSSVAMNCPASSRLSCVPVSSQA